MIQTPGKILLRTAVLCACRSMLVVGPRVYMAAAADVILRAADARITGTAWRVVADPSAAGGSRIVNADARRAEIDSGSRLARQLRRADVHRRRRHAVSAVDSRQGAGQQLRERFGARAVLGQRHVRGRLAHGESGRRHPRRTSSRTHPEPACRDGDGRTTARAPACSDRSCISRTPDPIRSASRSARTASRSTRSSYRRRRTSTRRPARRRTTRRSSPEDPRRRPGRDARAAALPAPGDRPLCDHRVGIARAGAGKGDGRRENSGGRIDVLSRRDHGPRLRLLPARGDRHGPERRHRISL